ncbi:MAG: hypothetical protein KDA36_11770, partial [Planctomycetaceae bacterium]|nr:hypothetical protein [Planctomycetaceae bacterium]
MKISARIRGTLTAVIWIVAAGIPFVFLWGTDIPLGVPGEWTWARLSTKPELLVGILPAVLSGAGLWGYVHFLGPSETRHRRFCDLPRWGGLWLIGVIWLFSLISAIPGPPGLGRLPFV